MTLVICRNNFEYFSSDEERRTQRLKDLFSLTTLLWYPEPWHGPYGTFSAILSGVVGTTLGYLLQLPTLYFGSMLACQNSDFDLVVTSCTVLRSLSKWEVSKEISMQKVGSEKQGETGCLVTANTREETVFPRDVSNCGVERDLLNFTSRVAKECVVL